MTILALEFSSAQRSVAIAYKDGVTEAIETGGQGTNAFGLIEKALMEARLERSRVDAIAVGLGPGSYTGIRVALAVAQGWQVASRPGSVQLLGVSSADGIAARAQAENIRGRINIVIDAQRHEFYLAVYELADGGWKEIEPLRILSRAEVELRARAKEILVGPEISRWFPGARNVHPRAAKLAQMALSRNDFVTGEALVPIYLRETNYVKVSPPVEGAPAKKVQGREA